MRLDGSSILFAPNPRKDAEYEAWEREERNYGPDHKFAYSNEQPRRCRKCLVAAEDHA